MARQGSAPFEADLEALRARIAAWRAVRTIPNSMPGELWLSAAALARSHGACPIARALHLDYKRLKSWMEKPIPNGLVQPAFVELPAATPSVPRPVPIIEITAPDGARMCIHLEAGHGREAARIVAAFLASRG